MSRFWFTFGYCNICEVISIHITAHYDLKGLLFSKNANLTRYYCWYYTELLVYARSKYKNQVEEFSWPGKLSLANIHQVFWRFWPWWHAWRLPIDARLLQRIWLNNTTHKIRFVEKVFKTRKNTAIERISKAIRLIIFCRKIVCLWDATNPSTSISSWTPEYSV